MSSVAARIQWRGLPTRCAWSGLLTQQFPKRLPMVACMDSLRQPLRIIPAAAIAQSGRVVDHFNNGN